MAASRVHVPVRVPAPVRIERHFLRISRPSLHLRLHWRQAGKATATPLVLLHPSPRHSAMFEPWMAELARHFFVLAPDTPGYGASDPLPQPATQLKDYLLPLRTWCRAVLGEVRPLVYGSATGAQLGIAWALAARRDIDHLVLDNAAHFEPEERAALLARYFPDFSPRLDGSHVQAAWQMALHMHQYFPWYAADEAHRVGPVPGPAAAAAVHATAMELLASPRWAEAYRCAFEHERAEQVQRLKLPTTVLRWQGSVLLKHIDALLAHQLPPQVQCVRTPADPAARQAANTALLLSLKKGRAP
jgi:pimeloyl-ACP methyl ester carboxylesterase